MKNFTNQRREYRRSGFTVIELIIVVLVIAILAAVSASVYSTSLTRANVNQTAVSMEILAAEFEDSLSETPAFSLDDDGSILDFLSELSEHSSLDFDALTVEKKSNGFTVMTAKYNDGFNQPYKLYFSKNIDKVLCISAGKNTVFQDESDYTNGSFDDDVVMLLQFK